MTDMKLAPLTEKQRAFVEAYITNPNATEAAEKAGYSHPDKQGSRVLKNHAVKAAIAEAMAERNIRIGVDKAFILAELHDALRIVKAEVKPKLNSKTGKPIKAYGKDADCEHGDQCTGHPVYVRNEPAIAKYLELLAKHVDIAAFDQTVNIKVTKEEELMEALKRGKARSGLSDGDNVLPFKSST